jgi:hypothetical protein
VELKEATTMSSALASLAWEVAMLRNCIHEAVQGAGRNANDALHRAMLQAPCTQDLQE